VAFMRIVRARLKPGPPHDRELAAPQYTGDRAEHKVPPLRFAPVGMTELFRYVGIAELFLYSGGYFDSVAQIARPVATLEEFRHMTRIVHGSSQGCDG
jgi:hypothetical protein